MEQYVYLSIHGGPRKNDLTSLLGLTPRNAFDEGDRTSSGKFVESNWWSFCVETEKSNKDTAQHFRDLFAALSNCWEDLVELSRHASIVIVWVICTVDEQPWGNIEPEIIAKMSELHASLETDMYLG